MRDYSGGVRVHFHVVAQRQIGRQMGQAESLLTVAEVAAELRVSTMTVYRLVKAGELPAFRIGKNYRIRRGDLDTYRQAGVVRVEQRNG